MKKKQVEQLKNRKRDAEISWCRIMENPDRGKIDPVILGACMGVLNQIDYELIRLGELDRR